MFAWHSRAPQPLAGRGVPLRLHDTASASVRPVAAGHLAKMYVCGITPYDATHLGHAATYVAFDLVNRAWRDAGHQVHYVQNVTDVDDPLLERALATGQDWQELARQETALFRADMLALNVLAPDDYVGAVESIPFVVQWVERLRRAGAVYEVGGDLYFDTSAAGRFGEVAGLSPARMRELFGRRGGDPARPGKRDPLDCLLWQSSRPDEPAWDTPLGHGRPGWHIECVAIALEHLGPSFDVQGGGRDLAFPHHEMSAALGAVASSTWPYARHYVHAGMVGLDGHKMSKSRGNLVFVKDLRVGHEPGAIRLALLAHHYRTDWMWTPAELGAAEQRLQRWRAALDRGSGPDPELLLAEVRHRLADDLDAPGALRAVDSWAAAALAGLGDSTDAPQVVGQAVDTLLGVELAHAAAPHAGAGSASGAAAVRC